MTERPDVIYHLAAVVSGEAEADFAKGCRVTLTATQLLMEAIAAQSGYCPRVVFASSLAVFGDPLPDVIPDDYPAQPLSSYGTQKAMGGLLINDLSRRGEIDGITLRLPSLCIRPGAPNAAASGCYSPIQREPLKREEAILPVPDSLRHWFSSPRDANGHAPARGMGQHRFPRAAAALDPAVEATIGKWPKAFDQQRALALGFSAETSMEEIIGVYLEDEHEVGAA